jgi:hypothetical protein
MRRTAEWFVEEARTTFLKDGTHVELFFLFKQDGSYSMGPRPPDMPKDQFVAVLRQRIYATTTPSGSSTSSRPGSMCPGSRTTIR